jgi:antitoxin VapB
MARSTVFVTNRSQAVRLPKPVAFPEGVDHVDILAVGQSRVLTPAGKRWDDFFLHTPKASADFMTKRDRNSPEEREPL